MTASGGGAGNVTIEIVPSATTPLTTWLCEIVNVPVFKPLVAVTVVVVKLSGIEIENEPVELVVVDVAFGDDTVYPLSTPPEKLSVSVPVTVS